MPSPKKPTSTVAKVQLDQDEEEVKSTDGVGRGFQQEPKEVLLCEKDSVMDVTCD